MAVPIPSITGGPATSRSGDVRATQSGTFSTPVVIGGFKSDGSAGAALSQGFIWLAAGVAAAIALFWFFRRRT